MKLPIPAALLAAVLLAAAAPAVAQDDPTIAQSVVLPMLQGASDVPAEAVPLLPVLAACIVAVASPEERAALAAAGAPGPEATAVVNGITPRPEVLACVQANAG